MAFFEKIAKLHTQNKALVNPYQFSGFKDHIIREYLDNKNYKVSNKFESIQIKNFKHKSQIYNNSSPFRYFYRRDKASRYPFVYTKLTFSFFPGEIKSSLSSENMLEKNIYTLAISQIWEERLSFIQQFMTRWHGSIHLRFKPNLMGGKIYLEIYTLKVKLEASNGKKVGYFKILEDIFDKINIWKSKVTFEEYNHSIETIYRRLTT